MSTTDAVVDAEVEEKLGRIRAHLDAHGLDGALLTTQPNVTWALGGRDHWVSRSLERSFAWVYVDADRLLVLALDNERARLLEEVRVESLGAELVTGPWWGTLEDVATTVVGSRVLNDGYGPGERAPLAIQRLRLELTDAERRRLRHLGAETCEAVEDALLELDARELDAMSERELSSRVVAGFETRGIVAGGIMVGGRGRRERFRHPVVTDAPVGRDALVVVVGVRGGLNVALSRTVSAGPVDPVLAERHALACAIEAAMIDASRPGTMWTDALEAGIERYAAGGHPDEWRAHTQGGPIGYGPREYIAYPRESGVSVVEPRVLEHQAFAWNPTVLGAKSEDTFIVDEGGATSVSNSDRWPALQLDGDIRRPAVLEL
jgi:Xaa-Pro dipeptidase